MVICPLSNDYMMPPVHWDVKNITRTDHCFVTNHALEIGEPLIVRIVKVHLALSVTWMMNRVCFRGTQTDLEGIKCIACSPLSEQRSSVTHHSEQMLRFLPHR